MGSDSQEQQSQTFAEDLTRTVQSVVPDCDPFTAVITDRLVSVRQSPREGVTLRVDGKPLLQLKATFRCGMDRDGDYLAIEKSGFEVLPHSGRQPIFRYEYVRDNRDAPVSHAHLHAHRDAFTYLMAKAGVSTKRAKRRATTDGIPQIQDLHFPLGGHRFRPCLEDVLETLIEEFGVDQEPGTMDALRAGREAWRRTQTKSVVRDDPASAIDVLRNLGYEVEWASDEPEPPVRRDRLRQH